MKKSRIIRSILFFLIGILSACGSSPQVEGGRLVVPPVDSLRVKAASPLGGASFLDGVNISNINQYIHPGWGLWLIRSSGAMPAMENTSQVGKNFPVDFSACKMEALPTVHCESKSFWTKEGCFVQEINLFKSEKIWMHCGLSEKEQAVIEEAAKTIRLTAVNTSFSARYYFSMIEGKWYLTFVDMRRPCEA